MTALVPSVKITVRGATIHVSATFYDRFGAPAEPPSVRVTFNYTLNGVRVDASYPMVFNLFVGTFDYDWDSSVVTAPGDIFWSIQSSLTDVPAYAGQGSFSLYANPANLGAT